jgi:hypothetical protein
MSAEVPVEVGVAQALVEKARQHVEGQLAGGWARADRKAFAALRTLLDQGPAARIDLSVYLAQMAPAAVLGGDASKGGEAIPNAGFLKMRSALLEAGLAEQQAESGALLEGCEFCPARLEASLDSWLTAGEYRGRENSPLTEIARIISRTVAESGSAPEEGLQTRLGLLIPVIASVHIWRAVHDASVDVQAQVGWCLPCNEPTGSSENIPSDA